MSNITNDNYHQLLTSENGELVYDIDDFSSPPDSPRPATTDYFDSMDMDTDVGFGFETIEQVNFSGLGPGGIVAEKVTGPVPPFLHQTEQQTIVPDTEVAFDWSSMINDPEASVSAVGMQGNSLRGPQLPLRIALRYESFPCPVKTELQAAADTPLADPRSPTISARWSTVSGGEVDPDASAPDDEVEMDIDDDSDLAAATDVLSLEPPFWNSSSSESSDDEDDTTFANDGWAAAADLELEQDWAAEQQLLQELRHEEPEECVRDWVRRGAVSG